MTEAVIAAVSYLTEAEVVLTAAEAFSILTVAAEVVYFAYAADASRRAQASAREDQRNSYNASLRDRYVMSRGATEPRQLVLGRQRVSGPVFFIQSYGSAREHLVFCVALAAHEIDAVEAVYFDDEQVIIDGSGYVTGVNRREVFSISAAGGTFTLQGTPLFGSVTAVARYGTTTVPLGVSVVGQAVTVSGASAGQTGNVTISYSPDPCPYVPRVLQNATSSITLNGSGTGSVVLPNVPISVVVAWQPGGDGIDIDATAYTTTVGSTVTVTAAPGLASATVTVSYTYDVSGASASRARVRKYLGAPGQVADAAMVTNLPGVWTAAHTATGVAYLVVELDYDPDAFPHGLPNVSAQVRGAKVYDPRTGVTAWTENPALLMRHAAISPLCGRLPASAINDASVIVAANACDVATTYVVNGQSYSRARYTAGTVVRSGTRGQDVLNDLAQAMGGKWAFIEGALKLRAGAYVTPLQTLDETWLSGTAAVQVQPRANRQDVFNSITGKFADESSDYQVLDVPRVASSAYITEDGAELPLNLQLNAVTFSGQAQQIEAQQMRDARQGLRVSLACNMRADPVEWGDTLLVNLARFGWVGKVFEVLDTSYTLDGGILLNLKETTPTIWDLGTSFAATDPAPNTFLPSPFVVPVITGLAVDSSAAVQVKNADGTVVQRMRVSWTALTDQAVLASGGGVEVRYGRPGVPEAQWTSLTAEGASTQLDVAGVQPGQLYLVKARAFNALVSGRWSATVKHAMGARSIAIDTPQIVAGAVGTAQMAAQSATEVFQAVAPGPYASGAGMPVAVVSFTPTVACDAVVTVEMDFSCTNSTGASAFVKSAVGISASGPGISSAPGFRPIRQDLAAGKSLELPLSFEYRFQLPAGLAVQFGAYYSDHISSQIPGGVNNLKTKVEMIKR
jgi:Putative phage tail protein